jgi:hypothetical protein
MPKWLRKWWWVLLVLVAVIAALAIDGLEIGPSLFLLCMFVVGGAACVGLRLAWRSVRREGAPWSEVALPTAFFVLVLACIVAGLAVLLAWPYRPMDRVSKYSILQQVGLCIAEYRADHDGAWPPTLQALYPNYLDVPGVLTTFPGEEIVYIPPRADAPPGQIVLHYFPRARQHGAVLLDNMRTLPVELDEEGRLVDPSTGAVLGEHGGR